MKSPNWDFAWVVIGLLVAVVAAEYVLIYRLVRTVDTLLAR